MNQRMTLAIAGALTGLVLVLMLGVGVTVAVQSLAVARTTAPAQAPVADTTASQPASASNLAELSADQAASIALKAVPNAKLTNAPELVNLQGTVAYQVTLNSGVVYVDANNGAVLFNSANTAPSTNVNPQRRSGEHSESRVGGHND